MVIYHGTIRRKSPSLSILNPSKLVILRTHAPLRHTSSKPFQQWRVPTHPLRLKQIQVDGGFSNDVKVIRYPYNGSFWYDQPQIYIYIYILYGHFSYWDFGKPPPKPATTIQPPWPKQRCFKEVSTCESSLTISRRRELCRKCHSSWTVTVRRQWILHGFQNDMGCLHGCFPNWYLVWAMKKNRPYFPLNYIYWLFNRHLYIWLLFIIPTYIYIYIYKWVGFSFSYPNLT